MSGRTVQESIGTLFSPLSAQRRGQVRGETLARLPQKPLVSRGNEQFNAETVGVLGIQFADCYSDDRLAAILEPHAGMIARCRFHRPTDPIIQSAHIGRTPTSYPNTASRLPSSNRMKGFRSRDG